MNCYGIRVQQGVKLIKTCFSYFYLIDCKSPVNDFWEGNLFPVGFLMSTIHNWADPRPIEHTMAKTYQDWPL